MARAEARPLHTGSGTRTVVIFVALAASATLLFLDLVTSGDPQAAAWLPFIFTFFLAIGLVAAVVAVLALRRLGDARSLQGGALAGTFAMLVFVVSGTCVNLLRRLVGGDTAALLAPLIPAVLAPLLAAAAGLLLAGLFGYARRPAVLAAVGVGLLAALAAAGDFGPLVGPALLVAIDAPLVAAAFSLRRAPDGPPTLPGDAR